MMHFMANMQYYMMFEVLECSWATLNKEMQMQRDSTTTEILERCIIYLPRY